MGFTRYFYTPTMTEKEVKCGVKAVHEVVMQHKDQFEIIEMTETSISVKVLSDNPVANFCFKPERTGYSDYVLPFSHCKTSRCPEDEGVREMLAALQDAVDRKIEVHPSGPDDWVTLDELRTGAVFITRDEEAKAVKSKYKYDGGSDAQWRCVLLASGKYAHFSDKNETMVQEIRI